VLFVSHGADDHGSQFLDGREPDMDAARVVGKAEALALDPPSDRQQRGSRGQGLVNGPLDTCPSTPRSSASYKQMLWMSIPDTEAAYPPE